MKKKIRENIVTWSSYELDGKVVDLVAKLYKLMEDKPDHFDFTIEAESESGYYGSCSIHIIIEAERWETDAEHTNRLASERDRRKAKALQDIRDEELKQQRERSLYEALKKKFEKEIEESTPNNRK